MAKADKRLAAKRLRTLIDQLGDERKRDTGWKTEVASELGIGPSILSKLDDPTRGVASETVQRVIDKLGIDPRFFYDRSLGDAPPFRDFVAKAKPPRPTTEPAQLPHWQDFLRLYDRIELLTPDDLDRIRRNWTPGLEVTSWRDWAQLANWLLDRKALPN